MKFRDNTRSLDMRGRSVPKLHGHTKITLTDVKTGKQEIVEKHNMVTDALAEMIFGNNMFGAMNYADITPVRDLLGGVMCFEDSLTELASNVLPPCDSDNKLIAHAGQTAYSGINTLRGNPNGTLSGVIQNGKGYKFVWDFATTQGNGTISALCLTHKLGGDLGLKPTEEISGSTLLTSSSNKTKVLQAAGDITYPLSFLISVDLQNCTGINILLSDSTLTVNEVALTLYKQGINDEIGSTELIDTHDVTLTRSFDAQYSAVCTDGTYIYVASANSDGGSTLWIDKIDMSTWTATAMDITDASLELSKDRLDSGGVRPYGCSNRTVISDGSIYWKKSDKRTFYRINLTNTADIEELNTNLTSNIDEYDGLNKISNGLLVGKNFFINGDTVYPMASVMQSFWYTGGYHVYPLTRWLESNGKFYVCGYYNDAYGVIRYAAVGYPIVYLGTIQNLENPVTKTNDKTMQIEYSIMIDDS